MTKLIRFAFGLVCFYLLALIILFIMQRSLLYPAPPNYTSLSDLNAPNEIRELDVLTQDGLHLKAWYAPRH